MEHALAARDELEQRDEVLAEPAAAELGLEVDVAEVERRLAEQLVDRVGLQREPEVREADERVVPAVRGVVHDEEARAVLRELAQLVLVVPAVARLLVHRFHVALVRPNAHSHSRLLSLWRNAMLRSPLLAVAQERRGDALRHVLVRAVLEEEREGAPAASGFIAVCIRFSFFVSTTPPPAFDLPPDLPFALSRPFIVQRHEAHATAIPNGVN